MKDKKYNKIDIIKIVVFIFELLGSATIAVLLALWDEVTLSKGIAILSADISVLFLIHQLINNISLEEIISKQNAYFNSISNDLDKIEHSINIEEICKKIYTLENREQKEIYLKSIGAFFETMNSRINGIRSGGLSRYDYYGELTKAADAIIEDINKFSNKHNYSGEIWAMTFWQDDELDFDDEYENAWIKKMEEMDSMGIKTKRICVMKHRKKLIEQTNPDKSTIDFLNKLKYYCEKDAPCKNTVLYAIDNIDSLLIKEQNWIGKGFFATKLSNGDLRLIRGVSLDNPNSNILGGEIDFDKKRVQNIREIWERLIAQSGEKTINSYLQKNSSSETRALMIEMNFSNIS